MEVIQVTNQGKQIFTFFPFSITFTEFIKFLHHSFQKVSTDLATIPLRGEKKSSS